MPTGPIDLQVIVTIALMLSAAVVALACDYLRHNYLQLQSQLDTIEPRQPSEASVLHTLAPQIREVAAVAPVARSATKLSGVAQSDRRAPSAGALAAMARGANMAPTTTVRPIGQPNTAANEESLPQGFHDTQILHRMIHSQRPITGLVVSIGMHSTLASRPTPPVPMDQLIRELLGPSDFAAAYSDHEFVLILPKEYGSSAQRRLAQISLKLQPLAFSLGSREAREEPLNQAVATASERMREARRGRKLPASAAAKQLRAAV
ncbi:MAG: hypothetical protein ABI811_24290 [Acidobacteriota bacterium]